MIGAIIGDIVGSRFEFRNTHSTDFELFTPECGYTDDTICTVAVADALLSDRDYGAVLHEWCNAFYPSRGGYGGNFSAWVHATNPMPYGSYGNGSAMRVSPCGYLSSREEVLREARKQAECTHNHPEGIKGAECTAECIYLARTEHDKQHIASIVRDFYGYDLDRNVESLRKTSTFDVTCQVTVPQAVICFLESSDFESAVRLAVSIGGDSDTISAITGSIAEAYYGVPPRLYNQAVTYLPPEMLRVITSFGERYVAGRSGDYKSK